MFSVCSSWMLHMLKLYPPVCQSLPCCRGVGGSVRGSAPAAGRSGRSQVWAASRRSPTSSLCCCSYRGAGWEGRRNNGLRLRVRKLTFIKAAANDCFHYFRIYCVILQPKKTENCSSKFPRIPSYIFKLLVSFHQWLNNPE